MVISSLVARRLRFRTIIGSDGGSVSASICSLGSQVTPRVRTELPSVLRNESATAASESNNSCRLGGSYFGLQYCASTCACGLLQPRLSVGSSYKPSHVLPATLRWLTFFG